MDYVNLYITCIMLCELFIDTYDKLDANYDKLDEYIHVRVSMSI